MDFTALVTGSALAGHSSPVSKPGIGLTAGAGASPTCDAPGGAGDDFGSLVDLALGQLGGETGEGTATAMAPGTGGAAEDEAEEGSVQAAAPPTDAPVDAATLAVLIALATPPAAIAVPTPATGPQADASGQASADLAAVDGGSAGTSLTAAEAGLDGGAPVRTASAAGTAAGFPDPVATPVMGTERAAVPATPMAAAPPEAAAPAGLPAATVSAATVAPAAAPDSRPPGTAEVTTAPAPAEATAPAASTAAAPSAAAPSAAAPHASVRGSHHPLRQALAAMAAEATPAPAVPSAPIPSAAAVAAAAQPAAPAPGAPVAAEAPSGHEPRPTTLATAEAPSFGAGAAASLASGAGSTGDPSSGGAPDGSTPSGFRGSEARLDPSAPPVAAATTGIAPEALPSGTLTAAAGFGAASSGEPALRAIDLPAAARFGQTLSTLDPDVRNMQAMIRTVRLFTSSAGATEARLTLEPEHLGPVALTVRVEQGSVSAHFRADTPAAHRWIETHQQELRSGLREQGLEVKEVVVTTDPDGRRERQQDEAPARPRARRQAAADAPRFEVLA